MRRRKIAAEGMVVVTSSSFFQIVENSKGGTVNGLLLAAGIGEAVTIREVSLPSKRRLAVPPAVAIVIAGLTLFTAPRAWAGIDPWADAVIHYNAGTNPQTGYTGNSNVVLGSPERVTGEVTPFPPFPGSVTMFSTPYGFDEIISIGAGGELIVRFDEPVIDRPGTDMLIFGNAFFALDSSFSLVDGIVSEPGTVEVSVDGIDWRPANGFADGLFPTQGFLDTDMFGSTIGTQPTDFLKPMNPSLTINDFLGLTYAQALALYDGSGGGASIDIAGSGLANFQFVRVSVPTGALFSTEVDAFAAVPEPATAGLFLIVGVMIRHRRRGHDCRVKP